MVTLPGTVLEISGETADKLLDSLFAGGGLYLSQVCTVTGLEAHTVQNWVKRGLVSPPVKKLYSKRQLCRIATINMLKSVLPLDTALKLLSYINGNLNDESDDMIDDSVLYLKFCRMAFGRELKAEEIKAEAAALSSDMPDRESRRRTAAVLEAMYAAHCSAEYKRKAEQIIASAEI